MIGPVLAWRRGNLAAALRRLAAGHHRRASRPADRLRSSTAPHRRRRLAGIALAAWAMLGVLTDLADRSGVAKLPPGTCLAPVAPSAARHLGIRDRPFRGRRADRRHHRFDRMAQRADRDDASPATRLEIAGRTLRFIGVTEGGVANYHAQRAQIVVERPGSAPMTLYPERRWYPVAAQPDHQHRDRHKRLWRSLSGARRSRRPRRLGVARLLQPARPVDLVWRDPRRPGRGGLAERPPVALARRRRHRARRRIAGGIGRQLMIRRLLLAAALLGAIGGAGGLCGRTLRAAGRPGARGARPGAQPGAALPRLPEPIDRRIQRRSRPRSARLAAAAAGRPAIPISRCSNYIVARYGVFVLLDPPFEPATYLLWLGPPALVLGAGAILLLRVSRRRLDPRLLDLGPNGPARAEASDSAIP